MFGVTSYVRSLPHPSALFRPCLQPSERVPARSVPSKRPPVAPGGGFDGTERAGTRSDGRTQGRNSADGCGEDRALGRRRDRSASFIPRLATPPPSSREMRVRGDGEIWRSGEAAGPEKLLSRGYWDGVVVVGHSFLSTQRDTEKKRVGSE